MIKTKMDLTPQNVSQNIIKYQEKILKKKQPLLMYNTLNAIT